MTDGELLAELARNRDPDLFRQLMQRHMDFVYAAAVRQSANQTAAQDITQAVFLLLWQRVGTLKPGTTIKGWLFNATRYVVANARRGEARRTAHEREAAAMRFERIDQPKTPEISDVLDDAIAKLSEPDRQAVLLRYFDDLSVAQLGQILGISEDAAKKRVTRAIDRLRRHLLHRGAGVSALSLPAVLAAHATLPIPTPLLGATMNAILAGSHGAAAGTAISLAKGATKMMIRNQIKLIVIKCVVATACVGAAAAVVTQEVRPPAAPAPAVLAQAQPQQPQQPQQSPDTSTATQDPDYPAVRGVLVNTMTTRNCSPSTMPTRRRGKIYSRGWPLSPPAILRHIDWKKPQSPILDHPRST
jgi:RNA polymerase sigma factor (sigma-70 family)